MKILVDGYYLEKPRGMGRYIQELLNALRTIVKESGITLTVVVPSHIKKENLLFSDMFEYKKGPSLPFPLWEQLYLPLVIRQIKPDLLHFPYNTSSAIAGILGIPYVVTIHDLIFRELSGGSIYQKAGNLYRSIGTAWNSKKHCRIITLSNYYVERITREMGFPSDRIYTSVDFYRKISVEKNFEAPTSKYFLHVGGISPHKNSTACIEAFLSLGLPDVKLVVLGMDADSILAKKFASDIVIFPGRVDDATMVAYARNSLAMLFPSFKEGYGLPIVEAFAFGVPLMVSDIAPMNEIAGKAGLLVDPASKSSMANAIKTLFDDPALRSRLIDEGTKRYEREMSARCMGEQVVQVYRRALGR